LKVLVAPIVGGRGGTPPAPSHAGIPSNSDGFAAELSASPNMRAKVGSTVLLGPGAPHRGHEAAVSTTLAKLVAKFAASVVDTGGAP
jgi:hypothetical protein